MGEGEELVEAPKLRTGVANLAVAVHNRRILGGLLCRGGDSGRRRRRRRLGPGLWGGRAFLILRCIGFRAILGQWRRRAEAGRTCHDVE